MSWSRYKRRVQDESIGEFLVSLEASRASEASWRLSTPPGPVESDADDSRIHLSDLPERPNAPVPPGSSSVYDRSSPATYHESTMRLRNSLARDPEFSFLSGATRLSIVRPTTGHESDWVTEPDTNAGDNPYGFIATTTSTTATTTINGHHRPNRLAPTIADTTYRSHGRYENVPPVPPVHAKYRQQLAVPAVERPFSFVPEATDEIEVNGKTIRVIQPDLALPETVKKQGGKSSIGFPGIITREKKKELTYPSLAPEELNVVKSQEGSLISVKALSNNVTILRPHQVQPMSPEIPDTDDGHGGDMETVVFDDGDDTRDFDNTVMAQGNVSNNTIVVRVDYPTAVARNPMQKFNRPFRPANIAIPTSDSFISGKATRSPMMGTSTVAGGRAASKESLLGEEDETGVIAGVKRMVSVGRNGRIVDWLGSVRSRAEKSWYGNRNSMAIRQESLPRTMPPPMPERPNRFVSRTSRDQVFGSQPLSELALSQRSYALPDNPFLYTRAAGRVVILYRIVVGLIFVPIIGFVVGTVAVKGGLDNLVYRVARGELAGFSERQRTVMQRAMWWVLVWMMAVGAFAILGALYLKDA